MKSLSRLALIATLAIVAAAPVQARTDIQITEMIGRYFDLLADGNLQIAGDMWAPTALERSSRFGITYTGIPLRVDAVSPIIRYLDQGRTQPILPIKDYKLLPGGNWYRLQYSDIYDGQLVTYYYFAQKSGDWYWLNYPQDYYAADWPVVESDFFRVHVHPDVQPYLNPAALREVDAFVVAMTDSLLISKESLEEIRSGKIEYFYCPSDSVVRDITGFLSKGQLDLNSNDIISSTFPHFHELTHLLVNIRLREVPLFTLPLLREGIAVRYGGRWGKTASTLLDLAVYLRRENFVSVDSLLTMRGFDSEATADLVYPEAGLFSAFLLDKLGLNRYFDLYLQLSGHFDQLQALTADSVRNAIIASTEFKNWETLSRKFTEFSDKYLEKSQAAAPGRLKKGKTILAEDRVTVMTDKDWVSFNFVYDSTMRGPSGCLMFHRDSALLNHQSSLFESHYEGVEEFQGFRFGIRFDRNEAGMYDYATNQLVAKYIWGITPSDEYLDTTAHTVALKVRRSLFHDLLPSSGDYLMLSW